MVPNTFDAEKFRELLLYVAGKSLDDPTFGATKLNKIMFFADFRAYGEFGVSITGASYQRLDRGPAPVQLLPVQSDLIEEQAAVLVEREYFNYPQKRLFPLRQPDLSKFSAAEIALVDEIIEALRHHNATEVSFLSHINVLGWQIAGDREDIPYEAVFLSAESLTPIDIRRGQEIARRNVS